MYFRGNTGEGTHGAFSLSLTMWLTRRALVYSPDTWQKTRQTSQQIVDTYLNFHQYSSHWKGGNCLLNTAVRHWLTTYCHVAEGRRLRAVFSRKLSSTSVGSQGKVRQLFLQTSTPVDLIFIFDFYFLVCRKCYRHTTRCFCPAVYSGRHSWTVFLDWRTRKNWYNLQSFSAWNIPPSQNFKNKR